jgi:acyl carrier protein
MQSAPESSSPVAHRSRAEIRAWIVAELARTLEIDSRSLDPAAPLESSGADSLTAITLTGALADWLQRTIPATLMWDYASIDAIAGALADEGSRPPHGKMSLEPLVSQYRRTQRDALRAFCVAHYGCDTYRTDPAYMDWAYSDPFRCQDNRSPLYVCELGGRIVGAQCAASFELKAGEQQCRSAWITDFAVLKELQRGIGTAIGKMSREANPIRFAMNVTAPAVALGLREGWQNICEVPTWARPLDARRTLEQRASWIARVPVWFLAQMLLTSLLHLGLRLAARARLHLVATEVFDDRADAIWSRVCASYQATCVRDKAFLQSRFDRFPRQGAYERYWLYQEETPVGYLVLRMGSHNGLSSASIVDYLCQPAMIGNLLALALNVCRHRGAAIAYCVTLEPTAGARLRPLGFFRRRTGCQFMAYVGECPEKMAQILSRPGSWFVTMADSNLDHEPAMAQQQSTASSSP